MSQVGYKQGRRVFAQADGWRYKIVGEFGVTSLSRYNKL